MLVAGRAPADDADRPPATRPAFDVIADAYFPHMDPDDPLAWPMKVRALSGDEYNFWRGSKEHFYDFAKRECADWLVERRRFIPTHGDPHFGNVGSYLVAVEAGRPVMAIGFVDFDESVLLPPEMDLLQGWIMTRLAARKARIPWTARLDASVRAEMIASYTAAVESGQTATELLSGEPAAIALLHPEPEPYAREVARLTEPASGRGGETAPAGRPVFRPVLRKSPQAEPTDALRPASQRLPEFASALARASAEQVSVSETLRYGSHGAFVSALRDAALRTRLKSSGSQGFRKYFVLIERPLVDAFELGSDLAVLYLKEEVEAPAERAGISPRRNPPARRVVEHARALTRPRPMLCGWVDVGRGESYWLLLRDPWGAELDAGDFRTRDDLLTGVRIWATVAGSAHAHAAEATGAPLPRLPAGRWDQVFERGERYLARHTPAFADFSSDPRTRSLASRAERSVRDVAGLTGN